ncbi:unnamed protein product [Heligmosomoides polygyrus]|uniref:Reverse transcriptase domain-containing protein n=1 Tax=Heligmosomoides polygyrus TaxID=6339 RepID=A0A183FGD5_HELPZ|nr:unnamed protein product [Heligmosomoides polygyrus]
MEGPLRGWWRRAVKWTSWVDQKSDQEGKEQLGGGARTGKPAKRDQMRVNSGNKELGQELGPGSKKKRVKGTWLRKACQRYLEKLAVEHEDGCGGATGMTEIQRSTNQ